jgi:hypothetical protein
MKIDVKDILKTIPGTTSDKDKKQIPNPVSVLKGVSDFARDKFETSTNQLSPKLLLTPEQPELKGLKDLDVFGIQDQLTKARMGADMVSKSAKNDDGSTKKKGKSKNKEIWSSSDKVKEEGSKSAGNNEELKKKYSNVMGQIDWKKGTTIFDVDGAVFRHPIDRKLKDEKAGKASATGRLDILSGRLRGYGLADFKLETLTAQLGLGLQGSLEAIGFHLELKHDAPSVKFFGRDASLHSIINVDAYVGIIAEAEATLNIDAPKGDGYLRLGAQVYAAATASISGKTALGKFVSVQGQGNAYAGVGAGAGLDVGFKDGSFSVSQGAGVAWLYGAGYNVGFSVNVLEIEKLGENMVKDAASRPVVWVWDEKFPWPWKPEFRNVVQAPGDFLQDVGHVLGVNGGSLMRLVDLAFGVTRKSEVLPETEGTPDKTEELREKPNRNTQPVA